MEAFLAGLVAKKAGQIAIAVLCLLGAIFTPVAVYQAFQINGIQVLWWGAPGLKASIATCQANASKLTDNNTTLSDGLKMCNASIDARKADGDKLKADAQKAKDDKQGALDAAQRDAGRLLAIKPVANALVTAYRVGTTGSDK